MNKIIVVLSFIITLIGCIDDENKNIPDVKEENYSLSDENEITKSLTSYEIPEFNTSKDLFILANELIIKDTSQNEYSTGLKINEIRMINEKIFIMRGIKTDNNFWPIWILNKDSNTINLLDNAVYKVPLEDLIFINSNTFFSRDLIETYVKEIKKTAMGTVYIRDIYQYNFYNSDSGEIIFHINFLEIEPKIISFNLSSYSFQEDKNRIKISFWTQDGDTIFDGDQFYIYVLENFRVEHVPPPQI